MDKPIRFTAEDADKAAEDWGMNCGPGAAAAILGLTLDEVRPHLGDFEKKGYTNPTQMWRILQSLGTKFSYRGGDLGRENWPSYGLARIQWEGPWTKPGVPPRVAYRHTHWVGSRRRGQATEVFDINCIGVGGWVSKHEWTSAVVPWLIRECVPKGTGDWFSTHAVEVLR